MINVKKKSNTRKFYYLFMGFALLVAILPAFSINTATPAVYADSTNGSCQEIPHFTKDIPGWGGGNVGFGTHRSSYGSNSRLFMLNLAGQADAPLGQVQNGWEVQRYYGPSGNEWNATNLGGLYGITLDKSGNIFTTASTYWSTPGPAGPGGVYKIDTETGIPAQFAQLPNDTVKKPGLANIAYDCATDMLHISNFENGLIYMLNSTSTSTNTLPIATFDHGAELSPAINDDGTAGITQLGRMIYGVSVQGDRLYYAVVNEMDKQASATETNEIWSVVFNASGYDTNTVQLEISQPAYSNNGGVYYANPIADITFTPAGNMLITERHLYWNAAASVYQTYAHQSRLLEYEPNGSGWTPLPTNKYSVGSGTSNSRDVAGGVDYDVHPDADRVWVTGDALKVGGTPTNNLYGLQGFPSGGLGGNANNSILIDYDGVVQWQDKTGIGDIEVASEFMKLGNQVWADTNGDGDFDSTSESGIDGVILYLVADVDGDGHYDPTVDFISSKTTTANGGKYEFSVGQGDFIVLVGEENWGTGGALAGKTSSTFTETDPDDNTDHDDEGDFTSSGHIASQAITMRYHQEPTGDDDDGSDPIAPDNSINTTVDFGFVVATPPAKLAIGNIVWQDDGRSTIGYNYTFANNGKMDGQEQGIAGIEVQLINPLTNAIIATTTTSLDGYYLFSDLDPGDYKVRIPATQFQADGLLHGFYSSTGHGSDEDTNDENEDENGIDTTSPMTEGITSITATLSLTNEPIGENMAVTGYADNNTNLKIDLGLVPTVAIGNFVWGENDGDGIFESANSDEVGISGVTVELYSGTATPGSSTPIMTTTTNTDGFYQFIGVPEGGYKVAIKNSEVVSLGLGYMMPSSSNITYLPERTDEDGQGYYSGNRTGNDGKLNSYGYSTSIRFDIFALYQDATTAGVDADTSTHPDTSAYMSVDFAFARTVAIGNFVWGEQDGDGIYGNDATPSNEVGLDGITVELYQSGNTPGVATPVMTTTTHSGFYLFQAVPEGDYFVAIHKNQIPALYTKSSAGGGQNPDTTDEDGSDISGSGGLGDDGLIAGNYAVSKVFSATVAGQNITMATIDDGDPITHPDNSAYMTIDFGFAPDTAPTAITLQSSTSSGNRFISIPFAIIGLALTLLSSVVLDKKRRFEM